MQIPRRDIERIQHRAQRAGVRLALPGAIERRRVEGLDEIRQLRPVERIIPELLQIRDILRGIMAQQDDIAFLPSLCSRRGVPQRGSLVGG